MEKQLIAIEEINTENAATVYKEGGLSAFFEHIKEQVAGEVPDISTAKGRDRIKSLAAQVSKSKTAVEKPGREYLKKIKELPKEIEKELRDFVTACDALRDEVRKPVTDFEEKEAARIEYHENNIASLMAIAQTLMATTEECAALLDSISKYPLGEKCEEFSARYESAAAMAKNNVDRIIESIKQHEELERIKKEQEIAAQKEREERIAREAKEAAEREAFEREARMKAEAEQAAKHAEIEKQQALQRAEDEKKAAIESERLKFEAQQKAEREAKEAAEREEEKRAANKAHQKTINNQILVKLMELGVSEEIGKKVIIAAAKNELANLTIKY